MENEDDVAVCALGICDGSGLVAKEIKTPQGDWITDGDEACPCQELERDAAMIEDELSGQ